MVARRFIIICAALALCAPAQAQQRQRPIKKPRATYWDGFALKQQGQCPQAVEKLRPLAGRGYGYEEAQVALGQCLIEMAGVPRNGGAHPPRARLLKNSGFRQGLDWILTAANAGSFTAQGELIALYAANLAPDRDAREAAKWVHLYLTNPVRLHLGAPILAQAAIDTLRARVSQQDWLAGKERARIWTPQFASLPQNPRRP